MPSEADLADPARYVLRDGIHVARDLDGSAYSRGWETAAATDHVQAAIARADSGETLEGLTAKVTGVWDRLCAAPPPDTVLDIGCGYGRIGLHLSLACGLSPSRYVGIDVSESMLRRFRHYRDRFNALPDTELVLVNGSAHELPLDDGSIDAVVSSAVFLHMGRRYVEQTLAEVDRVLAPGGSFIFESSFPNRGCPANVPIALRGLLKGTTDSTSVRLYPRKELETMMARSGLADRPNGYRIEAATRAILPKRIGSTRVPLAARLNDVVASSRRLRGNLVTSTFTVTSV